MKTKFINKSVAAFGLLVLAMCIIAPTALAAEISAESCDWTGTWDTSLLGQMVLQQSGNTVTGTYPNGGSIQGTVTGNDLVASWTLPTSGSGTFDITNSTDYQSFSGKWRFGTTGEWAGDWTGTRVAGA